MSTRAEQIQRIRDLPAQLEALVAGLDADQVTTDYDAGEWTIAQNIHHVADSHMHSYIRMKLAVTEDNPRVNAYLQTVWADMADASGADVDASLAIIRGLHARWADFMETIEDWSRTIDHPELGEMSLERILAYYSQHGLAHVEQINQVIAKMP